MTSYNYKAFISYSHADEAHGEWLQRALEGFRAPPALVGKETAAGAIPRRLTPIFRDRDDLPAAGNLNAEIQAALQGSQFQIVLCSPNAAKSRWVNEEIKLFKKLHGQERTLAVIVAGEPGASTVPGRESEECFPPALRFRIDDRGEVTNEPTEPIAADARKDGDGRRYAVLKLAAGLMGVGLDDLVRRDAQRRTRLAWVWTGASTALTLSMGGLAWYATQKGEEARYMRGEAEGLVAYMIGDFHENLKKVGRLDLLEATGERALAYYAKQDLKSLKDDALAQRAKALLIVGSVNQEKNHLEQAAGAYDEALAATGELLRRAPNDGKRVFDHAQSVFYVGDIARARGDLAEFETRMREYLTLAERLIAIDPLNLDYRLELAYANNNLGGHNYEAGDYEAAAPFFARSVAARKALHEAEPSNARYAEAYAYALSWYAYNEQARGGFKESTEAIGKQLSVYDPILQTDPENFKILGDIAVARRRLIENHVALGDIPAANAAVAQARAEAKKLLDRESANVTWAVNAARVEIAASQIASLEGDDAEAAAAADRAIALTRSAAAGSPAQDALRDALARRLEAGIDDAGRASAAEQLGFAFSSQVADASRAAAYGLALSRYASSGGDAARALEIARKALAAADAGGRNPTVAATFSIAQLRYETGDVKGAAEQAQRLKGVGFRHPSFMAFCKTLERAGQL